METAGTSGLTLVSDSVLLYAEQAQYHGLQAVDTRRHSVTHSPASTGLDIPPFPIRTFTPEATISDYTAVQNAGTPPHPSSDNPQPRTGSGLA